MRMLMPQEQKPNVRMNARVETLVAVAFSRAYSARHSYPTSAIFRKVAA